MPGDLFRMSVHKWLLFIVIFPLGFPLETYEYTVFMNMCQCILIKGKKGNANGFLHSSPHAASLLVLTRHDKGDRDWKVP